MSEAIDTPNPEDAALETEVSATALDDGKGNKMVPVAAVIQRERELRAANKRIKELEPVAASATDLNDRLSKAQPLIDALVTSPKLRAEALRIANGTRTSADTTDQPSADDDPDAAWYAEEQGYYLSDGQTPDTARARRILTRLDQRHGRQTDDRLRPLAGVTLSQQGNANLAKIVAMTDDHGVPLATVESIREVAAQLPANLLADERVVDLVLNNAIGIDRRKNRTPQQVDEPLYLETAGGGRGRRQEPGLTSDVKASLVRLGISEKDYNESSKRLEEAAGSRRGIVLGGK
jgi:hypothetical protein